MAEAQDSSYTPLIPISEQNEKEEIPPAVAWVVTIVVTLCSFLPILTLLPLFLGMTCQGMPTWEIYAIVTTVVGLLRLPCLFFDNCKRVHAGKLPSPDAELPDGVELYTGHKLLYALFTALRLLSHCLGAFWAFPIALMDRVRDYECDDLVYWFMTVSGLFGLSYTLINIIYAIAVFSGKKERPTGPVSEWQLLYLLLSLNQTPADSVVKV